MYVSSSCVFDLKKNSPKTFGPHCICWKSRCGSQVAWSTDSEIGPETKTYLRNSYLEMLYRCYKGQLLWTT